MDQNRQNRYRNLVCVKNIQDKEEKTDNLICSQTGSHLGEKTLIDAPNLN